MLVEPPAPEGSGETYVEWTIESRTSEPLHMLIGICGEDAAEAREGLEEDERAAFLVEGPAPGERVARHPAEHQRGDDAFAAESNGLLY